MWRAVAKIDTAKLAYRCGGSAGMAGRLCACRASPASRAPDNGRHCRQEACTCQRSAPHRPRYYCAMPSRELSAALEAARAAAEVIQASYRRNLAVTLKSDRSPVTAADVEAERVIHAVLSAHFPDYGFYGEETGQHAMGSGNVWLVDPIGGTKAFVRDCPFFSTQIALRRAGRLVLGVSSAPAYGELAWAEEGSGAFLDGQAIHVSAVSSLGEAILSTGNLRTLAAAPAGWSRFGTLVGQVN